MIYPAHCTHGLPLNLHTHVVRRIDAVRSKLAILSVKGRYREPCDDITKLWVSSISFIPKHIAQSQHGPVSILATEETNGRFKNFSPEELCYVHKAR